MIVGVGSRQLLRYTDPEPSTYSPDLTNRNRAGIEERKAYLCSETALHEFQKVPRDGQSVASVHGGSSWSPGAQHILPGIALRKPMKCQEFSYYTKMRHGPRTSITHPANHDRLQRKATRPSINPVVYPKNLF